MRNPDLQQSATIVRIHRGRRPTASNALRVVEGYWSALRQEGQLPARSQVDPRGLEDVLEYAFILERDSNGLASIRIAGSQLTGLAGMDLRGIPISALFTASARLSLSVASTRLFDGPAVIEASLRMFPKGFGEAVGGDMILLPMTCDRGSVNRALGALIAHGPTPAQAYSLSIGRCRARPVDGRPDIEPACQSGFAEPANTFEPNSPALRLVVSNA